MDTDTGEVTNSEEFARLLELLPQLGNAPKRQLSGASRRKILQRLIGDSSVEDWLLTLCSKQLASDALLAVYIAAGTLARLWRPSAGDASALLARAAAGEAVTPSQRLVVWAAELTDVNDVFLEAMLGVERLAWDVSEWSDAPPDSDKELAAWTREIVELHDDLVSVHAVLHVASGDPAKSRALSAGLKALDVALKDAIHVVQRAQIEDQRFVQVALDRPEGVWGALHSS